MDSPFFKKRLLPWTLFTAEILVPVIKYVVTHDFDFPGALFPLGSWELISRVESLLLFFILICLLSTGKRSRLKKTARMIRFLPALLVLAVLIVGITLDVIYKLLISDIFSDTLFNWVFIIVSELSRAFAYYYLAKGMCALCPDEEENPVQDGVEEIAPVKPQPVKKIIIRLALALCAIGPTVGLLYLSDMDIGPVFMLAVLWAGIWGIGLFVRYQVKTAGEKDKKLFCVITGILIACLIGILFMLNVMESLSF